LDFCKWSTNLRTDKQTVDWPNIERELKTVESLDSRDILDFEQVNFIVSGVKISFLTKQENLSPVTKSVAILNHIKAADLEAIGAMKVELMLRSTEWRDYYDIYSILMSGISLKSIVTLAGTYSNHKLKTRVALNFLINVKNYKKTPDSQLFKPAYNIDGQEREELILLRMKQEYV
jgi:hypothetical protein